MFIHIATVWHQFKTLRQSETLGNAAGDGVELLAQLRSKHQDLQLPVDSQRSPLLDDFNKYCL